MGALLVHVRTGPDDPTTAALSFAVAKAALRDGHQVTVFLAGHAVELITDQVLKTLTGHGTGQLGDHFAEIVVGGGQFYVGSMSASARGITESDLIGKPAVFALPDDLVKLTMKSDQVLTY